MERKRLSRQESRLQTRERLLEAAAEVFSRRGFHDASVEEVAEKAGFSKGAVYSNFASKEELFLTLLDRHLAAELQKIAAQVTPNESQGEAERASPGRSFADQLEENRTWNVFSLEFFLYALHHPWAQQRVAERYRLARQELTTRLRERYQAEGGVPAFPVEYLAWALLALGSGLALQAYLEPGALPSDLYATVVKRLLDAPRP
ncbi:MAG TPA: TetR/AcrR family transcriptional regulator [Ktedonobacteraceae bacterium]